MIRLRIGVKEWNIANTIKVLTCKQTAHYPIFIIISKWSNTHTTQEWEKMLNEPSFNVITFYKKQHARYTFIFCQHQ